MTLRALVSTKDAGVIIGKAGKNVADLREQTGVKAGVSKVIPGVHERVLTVTGPIEGVAKVCNILDISGHRLTWILGLHPYYLATRGLQSIIPHHIFLFNRSYFYPALNFP